MNVIEIRMDAFVSYQNHRHNLEREKGKLTNGSGVVSGNPRLAHIQGARNYRFAHPISQKHHILLLQRNPHDFFVNAFFDVNHKPTRRRVFRRGVDRFLNASVTSLRAVLADRGVGRELGGEPAAEPQPRSSAYTGLPEPIALRPGWGPGCGVVAGDIVSEQHAEGIAGEAGERVEKGHGLINQLGVVGVLESRPAIVMIKKGGAEPGAGILGATSAESLIGERDSVVGVVEELEAIVSGEGAIEIVGGRMKNLVNHGLGGGESVGGGGDGGLDDL